MIPSPRDAAEGADPSQRRARVSQLAAAASAGDRAAFGELYRMHYSDVLAYVRCRCMNVHLAEDIASETFVRALRAIGSFTWTGNGFGAWLNAIARNLLVDHYKSAHKRCEVVTFDLQAIDSTTAGPEQIVLERITWEALRMAVDGLSPLQQACVRARFLDELTLAETAKRLDRGEGTIRALQYRATRTLARDAVLASAVVT
jgi:RNA polymerase sigma-70 factor (ECF subfamily)